MFQLYDNYFFNDELQNYHLRRDVNGLFVGMIVAHPQLEVYILHVKKDCRIIKLELAIKVFKSALKKFNGSDD